MKTFKQYSKNTEKGTGVIPVPIHFKHTGDNSGVIPQAIHFKHVKEEYLREERVGNYDAWKDTNENSHLGHTSNGVRKKLVTGHNVNSNEKKSIEDYTRTSRKLNGKLIRGEDLTTHTETAKNLDAAIDRNPIPHAFHAYSGLGFDPHQHTDEHGKLRSPAYISATHDKETAHSFTTAKGGIHHIARISLKPGDPATHIAPYSGSPHEHETIIKRGVTLQHHGHQDYRSADGDTYRVHNLSIDRN